MGLVPCVWSGDGERYFLPWCVGWPPFHLYTDYASVAGQLWSLSTTTIQVRLKIQLNTLLFSKTLVRKDVASSAAKPAHANAKGAENDGKAEEDDDSDDSDEFSSKAQIMTLMTTDVDTVSDFSWHLFALVGKSIPRFLRKG